MECTYDVFSGGQSVGTVQIRQQGLYDYFICRCSLTGEVIFRLVMQRGGQCYDLGILAPENGSFQLCTKVARKKLGVGEITFCLKPAHKTYDSLLVDISPVEPFAYLWRLEEAYLAREKDVVHICFREKK